MNENKNSTLDIVKTILLPLFILGGVGIKFCARIGDSAIDIARTGSKLAGKTDDFADLSRGGSKLISGADNIDDASFFKLFPDDLALELTANQIENLIDNSEDFIEQVEFTPEFLKILHEHNKPENRAFQALALIPDSEIEFSSMFPEKKYTDKFQNSIQNINEKFINSEKIHFYDGYDSLDMSLHRNDLDIALVYLKAFFMISKYDNIIVAGHVSYDDKTGWIISIPNGERVPLDMMTHLAARRNKRFLVFPILDDEFNYSENAITLINEMLKINITDLKFTIMEYLNKMHDLQKMNEPVKVIWIDGTTVKEEQIGQ